MNRYFLDSSAYAKLFIHESGTDLLIDLVHRSEDKHRTISVLAAIEVRSAIRRRQIAGDITVDDAECALALLQEETKRIVDQPLTQAVVERSKRIVDHQSLRALDAIQLASALELQRTLKPIDSLFFIAADKRLLDAAAAEGLRTWNPSNGDFVPQQNKIF